MVTVTSVVLSGWSNAVIVFGFLRGPRAQWSPILWEEGRVVRGGDSEAPHHASHTGKDMEAGSLRGVQEVKSTVLSVWLGLPKGGPDVG